MTYFSHLHWPLGVYMLYQISFSNPNSTFYYPMNPNFRQPAQQIVYHIRKAIVYILHYYFSFYSPYWLNL